MRGIHNRGIVSVVKREAVWDEESQQWVAGGVKDSFTINNVVTYKKNREEVTDFSNSASSFIWVSEKPRVPNLSVSALSDSEDFVKGTDIVGTDKFIYTQPSDPDPGFWTVSQRFNPPATTRNVETIAIIRDSFGVDQDYTLAYVSLETPCPQEDNEILDIFYRITIDQTVVPVVNGAYNHAVRGLGEKLWFSANFINTPGYPRHLLFQQSPNISDEKQSNIATEVRFSNPALVEEQNDLWRSVAVSLALEDNIGNLFGAGLVGSDGTPLGSLPILRPGDTPIQSLFGKSQTSLFPFLDAGNSASGAGTVTPNGDAWTDPDYPYHYRVEITLSGEVGVSEYKFSRRRQVGYVENTYQSRKAFLQSFKQYLTILNGIAQDGEQPFEAGDTVRHGQIVEVASGFINETRRYSSNRWRQHRETNFNGRLESPHVITFDDTGITVMDVAKDVVFDQVDGDSTPALPVSELSQLDIESDGTIWAACRQTGLYRIDRDSSGLTTSVTRVTGGGLSVTNDSKCYGVTVKRSSDDIWAIFEDTLAQSTDGGANWTLYNEGTPTQYLLTGFSEVGNYSRHTALYIDPVHADDRLVLGAPDTVNSNNQGGRIIWWSRANSNPASDALRTANSFSASGIAYTYATQQHAYSNNGVMYIRDDDSAGGGVRGLFGGVLTSLSSNASFLVSGGVVLIDDGSGNDLVVGYDSTNNTFRGRTDAELGTITAGINLGPGTNQASENISGTVLGSSLSLILPGGVGFHWANDLIQNNINIVPYFTTVMGVYNEPDSTQDFGYAIWEQYGWNGVNWVLNDPNSKVTHVAQEDLIDGLTVAFADGGSPPHFVSTDYYLFGVNNGILKDDATTFDYEILVPMTQTEVGSSLTPSTVPAVDTGSVTGELASWDPTSPGDVYTELGDVCGADVGTEHCQAEQELEGDFTIQFGIDPLIDDSASSTSTFGVAVLPYADQRAVSTWTSGSIERGITFKQLLGTDDLTWRVYEAGVSVATGTIANATFDRKSDTFSIVRTGSGSGNVQYLHNAAVLYTSAGESSGPKCVKYLQVGVGGAIYNCQLSYTANKRIINVGNGTNTGNANVNFKHLPKTLIDSQMSFSINGVPAAVIIDPFVNPAAGEVKVLRNGQLHFNPSDASLPVTASWLTNLKLNLV